MSIFGGTYSFQFRRRGDGGWMGLGGPSDVVICDVMRGCSGEAAIDVMPRSAISVH